MFYELSGSDQPNTPTIVLSSGLGGSADFWTRQLPVLEPNYRVLVYDHLGTGRSPEKLPINYSIESMADELLALLRYLKISSCHFIGHALGGLVGLQMALLNPEALRSMVLINAWGSPNPHTLRCFHIRKSLLQNCSPEIYLQTQALLLYPPDWIVKNVEHLQQQEENRAKSFPDKDNLLLRIKALSEFDIDDKLSNIEVNSLLVANKDDVLVPWQRSEALSQRLPNAKLHLFDYGGHACTVTQPKAFNEVLLTHLASFEGTI